MSENTLPPIASLMPHSGPMLLLDRVIAADEENLCAEVRIGPGTLFSDANGVAAWVGVEYMAQAIAAHAGYTATLRGEPVRIGFLLGTRRYESSTTWFAQGSVLHVHVHRVLQGENGLGAFDCRIVAANDATESATSNNSPALALATVTVFQPANATEFLQE